MPTNDAARRRQFRRVASSSFIGSAIEYYDFLLYGAAASLVFNELFFTGLDPVTGTIASFATLAVGYVARPLGGIVFGHFGDKVGRKSMLVLTMTLMGLSSFVIGLLPTYDTIGVWAPVLLVAARLVQGVAVGGEWGGAALMALEHAPANRRGLAASFANMGGPAGAVLATAVLGLFSALPEEQFLSWGWRVPFLLSILLLAFGMFIRLKVTESPVFAEAQAHDRRTGAKRKAPLFTALRRYPKNIALAAFGGVGALVLQSLLATFVLSHALDLGYQRSTVLTAQTMSSALHIFTIPAFALLSDRIGRKPVMITGALASAAAAFPLLALVNSGSTGLLFLAFVIGNPLLQASMYGPMAAFISEMFGTRARYTGASLGYQLASTLGAGVAPLLATTLLASAGGGTHTATVSLFLLVVCLISAGAIALTKEGKDTDLDAESAPPTTQETPHSVRANTV
ncbi:MHS family MFS transporter [Streptomyces sp. NBC_01762]|uniref:MFS transporter n=1 Tax=unclassified Streptomyces TaxID=2593676 RepID=UPI002DD7C047|nr:MULTISPECIES: MFS transporter [unclassified Streptomyces]WSC48463.1 MHS family MFS transporter [Streptomyces sp. NBC_01762]WSD28115.1 MHS family MFS transporter [Streptomyces sp. NBC_01751]